MASRISRSLSAASTFACALLLACTSSEPGGAAGMAAAGTGLPIAGMNAAGIGGAAAMGATGGTGAPIAGMNAAAGTGVMAGATGGVMSTGGTDMPVAGTDMPAGTTGGMDIAGGAGGMDMTPLGPEDGDPMQPIVSIPDMACGGPTGGFGLGSPNFTLGGREMIVTYPCEKHAGAPATFVLNLHGTTPIAQHFYQHGYFAVHEYTSSHNLIVVTPSSVVTQWGNGDDGLDEPHLFEIIDWVYANLNGPGKFDIRGMWVGGHSWGGGYAARFGCNAMLEDKVKGLILMSGGSVSGGFGAAACASRVAAIVTTAEGDGRMPGDQMTLAASHGCDAAQTETILMNDHTSWPNCDPGFVHANYYMRGKEHATFMDDEVVHSIADWIKLSRQ